MNNYFVYFFIAVCLCSCSGGIRTVKISSIVPSAVTIPSTVKSLVIVDRTKYKSELVDLIEGTITGELPEEDKAAVQILNANIKSELDLSPRFTTKIASERLQGNSHTQAFPAQIDWDKVQELCTKYAVDALVSIEFFDTDFVITDGKRQVQKKIKNSNGVQEIATIDEYFAEGVNTIKLGIKVYNPKTKTIADQYSFNTHRKWNSVSSSRADALSRLMSRSDANKNMCRALGTSYGNRIAPMKIMITRSFRGKHKKCPELEQGARYADVAKWKDAIDVWEKGLNDSDPKASKFLSYNIAVEYEVLGNYEKARDWASTSYIQYDHDEAKTYLSQLKKRIQDEKRSKEQIGE